MNVTSDHRGFTLTEILIALGITGVLLAVAWSLILRSSKSLDAANSRADLSAAVTLVNRALSKALSEAAQVNVAMACSSIVVPANAINLSSPTAQTPVQLHHLGLSTLATSSQRFGIEAAYLSDVMPVNFGSTRRVFVANLYVRPSLMDDPQVMSDRMVTTLLVTLDSSGHMTNCNANPNEADLQHSCDAVNQFTWDSNTAACVQSLPEVSGPIAIGCPPATRLIGSQCVPQASNCGSGLIPQSYTDGLVDGCVTSPTSKVVGKPAPPAVSTQEGAPAPAAPAAPSIIATVSPTTFQTLTAPPSSTAPSSCTNSTSLLDPVFDSCQGDPSCLPTLASVTRVPASTCTSPVGTTYKTPDLSVIPVSSLPTPVSTCGCNGRQIPDGAYCVFCIQNVGFGYGYVGHFGAVQKCSSGSYVSDATPIDSSGVCNGLYARGKITPFGIGQYSEF